MPAQKRLRTMLEFLHAGVAIIDKEPLTPEDNESATDMEKDGICHYFLTAGNLLTPPSQQSWETMGQHLAQAA
jgi:hypothetical protein